MGGGEKRPDTRSGRAHEHKLAVSLFLSKEKQYSARLRA